MSIPTLRSSSTAASRNLHNLFLQNELRNHKKKLTGRRSRRTRFMDERDYEAWTAISRVSGERRSRQGRTRAIQSRTGKDRIISDSRAVACAANARSEGQEGLVDETDLNSEIVVTAAACRMLTTIAAAVVTGGAVGQPSAAVHSAKPRTVIPPPRQFDAQANAVAGVRPANPAEARGNQAASTGDHTVPRSRRCRPSPCARLGKHRYG